MTAAEGCSAPIADRLLIKKNRIIVGIVEVTEFALSMRIKFNAGK
tara:strand:- start:18484 stop:18618 length:135 start_codon:yes stop_codon:yes gene_type:complete